MIENIHNYEFDIDNQSLRLSSSFSISERGQYSKEQRPVVDATFVQSLFEHTPQIVFEVTEKCNYNCRYCGYGENYKQPKQRPLHANRFMTWSTAKTLLDKYLEIWKKQERSGRVLIGFYGGEPLLNFPLIKKIVFYLEQNKSPLMSFGWFITTNGCYLKKYADFLIEKKFSISVSLDGDAKSNSYRTFQNGTETYSIVVENIDYIYEHYPDFFKESVSFQSVITNKTSVIGVLDYFKKRYNTTTNVIELSQRNLCEDNCIHQLFRKIDRDLEDTYSNHKSLYDELDLRPPITKKLAHIIKSLTSYHYSSYEDFFNTDNDSKRGYYSGTCLPFQSRLFLSTQGYVFPCEKVDFESPLGYVRDGSVVIDFDALAEYYTSLYGCLKHFCPKCIHQFDCNHCFVQDGYFENGIAKCSDFKKLSQDEIEGMISFLKSNSEYLPQLFDR